MKTGKIVEEFGDIFMEAVWDSSILQMEMILSGKMKSQEAQILNKKINKLSGDDKKLVKEIIAETIRRSIFNVLNFFDGEENYFIGFDNGEKIINIKELSDGLAGELYGENGWIKRYSKNEIRK